VSLLEMAREYEKSAAMVYDRIAALEQKLNKEMQPGDAYRLRQRITALYPLYHDCRAMAGRCRHYYEDPKADRLRREGADLDVPRAPSVEGDGDAG